MGAVLRRIILERGPAARATRWGSLLGTTVALYAGTGVYLLMPGATDLGTVHALHYLAVPLLVLLSALALVGYALPVTLFRAFGGEKRPTWAHLGVFAGASAGVILMVGLPRIAQKPWEAMLARTLSDHPLPAAVHAYEARHGHLPATLEEVAPTPAALQTVRGCRALTLRAGAKPGEWSLVAECPVGLIAVVDQIRYRAGPAASLERGEVRVGRWRYFYD